MFPLQDLTNLENVVMNEKSVGKIKLNGDVVKELACNCKVHCHNPYNWNCLDDETPHDLFEASSS